MPKVDLNRLGIIKCFSCGKECFNSIQDARKAAKAISTSMNAKYSAYYCDECRSYHIGHLSTKDTHEDEIWWQEYKNTHK